MFLIAGIRLPAPMLEFFQQIQTFFPNREWEPEPFLFLPLVIVGETSDPDIMENLDAGLLSIQTSTPATLVHAGLDVVQQGERIILTAKILSAVCDHLSVKIRRQAQHAGLKVKRTCHPLSVPLATISTVPPEDVHNWLRIHHSLRAPEEEVYEFTLFSSWKNRETTDMELLADYAFTSGCIAPPSLL